MDAICADLAAEHQSLDSLVAELSDDVWTRSTPAAGWSIADSISHLVYFDETAKLAATDGEAFKHHAADLVASIASTAGGDPSIEFGRTSTAANLLTQWRANRAALLGALRSLDPKTRVPWYGPAMSARSFATARLMETWAHGQDIVDALGVNPIVSDRLKHVAHIGVGARPFSYMTRGMTMPDAVVHVALRAPSGKLWTWGDVAAGDIVRGNALDFCLAVTQRRHVDDVDLEIVGDAAREWMSIAQSFAGAPGSGRESGAFRDSA
jgi:uncharacterized protein (TIGR03084 family)